MIVGHVHRCPLCDVSKMCTTPGCMRLGLPLRCSECSAGIADVDALPNPKRPALSFVDVAKVVRAATAAAVEMVLKDPERCLDVFRSGVEGLRPGSGQMTPDAWARRGAIDGAVAAWTGCQAALDLGPPQDESACTYSMAYWAAAFVVQSARGG